ncbi:T9SS type A sorting domain-containing protein [Aequorivita antarctica]|nr:T9SS type A sorting domain-containing protein [Aequorivita antarctica]
MKKVYLLYITVFIFNLGFSQEEVWSKLFSERLDFSQAVPKNVVFTNDLKIIYPVVEDGNLLRIYKLNENGDIVRILDTEESVSSISEIVKISETEFSLIFNVEPLALTPIYKVIHFNELLQITSETILNLPIISNFVNLIRFFNLENQQFVTFNDNGTYYLMHLNGNSELDIIYTSTNNVFVDHISILPTGNLLIDFSTGQAHILKCINTVNGNLIWEKNYGDPSEINLDYIKTFDSEGNIYMFRLIRNFINGEIFDTIELLKINGNDGSVTLNSIENPPNDCVLKFEDLEFNKVTQEVYFSYSNCSDPGGIILKSFSKNLEPLHTINVDAAPDGFFASVAKSSQIIFRDNGKVVFIYRSYKNVEEFDNIYFLSLTSNLLPLYTGELNIPPKNGTELFADAELFGEAKAVIIGDVPHKDPNVSWEVVQFFISMIDLDVVLNIEDVISNNVALFPNPSKDKLNIISSETFESFQVFDVSGKMINCPQNLFQKNIDISNLSNGIYFLRLKTSSLNTIHKQFIKF